MDGETFRILPPIGAEGKEEIEFKDTDSDCSDHEESTRTKRTGDCDEPAMGDDGTADVLSLGGSLSKTKRSRISISNDVDLSDSGLPKTVEIPTRPIDLEVVGRMRALHNQEMDKLKVSVSRLIKKCDEMQSELDTMREYRAGRCEGMLRKLYAFMNHCRENNRLPPPGWWRTSGDYIQKPEASTRTYM